MNLLLTFSRIALVYSLFWVFLVCTALTSGASVLMVKNFALLLARAKRKNKFKNWKEICASSAAKVPRPAFFHGIAAFFMLLVVAQAKKTARNPPNER